jgi:hypothetical protein
MRKEKISCIYKIENVVTHNLYIGSSSDFIERQRRHRRDLRKGKHHSRYLQRAWNKYGEEAFLFSLLELCDEEDLLEREGIYLLNHKPVYNMCPEAGSPRGKKSSEATKRKIGRTIRKLGIKPPESTWKDRQKRVAAVDPTTDEVIKIFDSIAAACRWMGRDHTFVSMISRCCNGKSKAGTAWRLKWRWVIGD